MRQDIFYRHKLQFEIPFVTWPHVKQCCRTWFCNFQSTSLCMRGCRWMLLRSQRLEMILYTDQLRFTLLFEAFKHHQWDDLQRAPMDYLVFEKWQPELPAVVITSLICIFSKNKTGLFIYLFRISLYFFFVFLTYTAIIYCLSSLK